MDNQNHLISFDLERYFDRVGMYINARMRGLQIVPVQRA